MRSTKTREREQERQTPAPPLRHIYPDGGWSGRPDGLGDIAYCGHRRVEPWDGSTAGNGPPPPHLCVVCVSMEWPS